MYIHVILVLPVVIYSVTVLQPTGGDDGMVYWQDKTVEGTCQHLEKRYLRLTSVSDIHAAMYLFSLLYITWSGTLFLSLPA